VITIFGKGTATTAEMRFFLHEGLCRRAEPWRATSISWLTATVEVSVMVTRPRLSQSLGQPIPGLGRMTALSCDDSPVGPFQLAILSTISRTSGMMRDWVLDVICDGPVGDIERSLGLPARPGSVSVNTAADEWFATVADGDEALVALRMRPNPVESIRVPIDAMVYPTEEANNGGPPGLGLVSVAVTKESGDAYRDPQFHLELGPGSTATDWEQFLQPTWPIVATAQVLPAVVFEPPVSLPFVSEQVMPTVADLEVGVDSEHPRI
jgi:hypothetical protein